MTYFLEINDGKSYAGHDDDFHFIYNANTGGGQSFLGGKFRDDAGNLVAPATLNGRIGVFRFALSGVGKAKDVMLTEPDTQYEIKPRAAGDNNMKLSVGAKPTPSAVISTFLMLPETCGVKRSENIKVSALSGGNFWVHSMWMSAAVSDVNKAILTLRDCVLCGGVDKQGQGQARYFVVDFKNRISDIIAISEAGVSDPAVQTCVNYFADIYTGIRPFVYSEASTAVRTLMNYMAEKYPANYSGLIDPMSMIWQFVKRRAVMQDGILQLITYGAPGTGKSFRTKGETEGKETFRTTFHPDSDYSTFVGAYKPTMKTMPRVAMINDGKDAVKAGGDEDLKTVEEITYDFIPQAFVKAYVAAWQKWADAQMENDGGGGEGKADPVFLVIEEINRGNCAQIFGDLFQLLDRDDAGYSDYPIEADADLARWLKKQFGGGRGATALPADVASGRMLVLPPNLYIRATMNTSDQSLFPIDSAFKRRWDWEYVPIKDEGKGWYVKVGADKYKWWSFLKEINRIVYEETSSADKQMGYFFVKLPEGQKEIDLKKFVNKVAFYLWNDVFKDCEIRENALKLKDANGKPGEPIKFTDFFKEHSSELNEEVVKNLFEGLGVEKEADEGSEGA